MSLDDYRSRVEADRASAPNRIPGFYWVLITGYDAWYVCQYDEEYRCWLIPGREVPEHDTGSTKAVGPLSPVSSGIAASLEGIPLIAEAH